MAEKTMTGYVRSKSTALDGPKASLNKTPLKPIDRESAQRLKFDTSDLQAPGLQPNRYAEVDRQSYNPRGWDEHQTQLAGAQNTSSQDNHINDLGTHGQNDCAFGNYVISNEECDDSENQGKDDARNSKLSSDTHASNFASQNINEFMFNELLSLTPEERQVAGFGHLEAHFTGPNAQYACSYPSTTSGRVEESEDDAMFLGTSLIVQRRGETGIGPLELRRAYQNHGAAHTEGLVGDYRSASQAPEQAEQLKSNPTVGSKRKVPGELPPIYRNGFQAACDDESASARHNGLPLLPNDRIPHATTAHGHLQGAHALRPQQMNIPLRDDFASTVNRPRDFQSPAVDMSNLDHEPKTLYGMDFATLQNEPFDKDPFVKPLGLATNSAPEPLASRLELLANRPAEDQQRFLASLSLEEWKEVGEWFTVKFKEATDKLSCSREDQRQIIREFEEEIARRYEAVTKETNSLDTSLKEMKAKGTLVLSSETIRKN